MTLEVEAQKSELDGGVLFKKQLCVMRDMMFAKAAAQGLCNLVYVWINILECIGPGCGWSRTDLPNKDAFRSFITVLAWTVGGRWFPKGTARMLEVMFSGLWDGVPVGMKRGTWHPFSDPVRRSDLDSQQIWNDRVRETAMACRRRRAKSLSVACAEFRSWCQREYFFYLARVVFYDSSWPTTHLTSQCFSGLQSQKKATSDSSSDPTASFDEELFGNPLADTRLGPLVSVPGDLDGPSAAAAGRDIAEETEDRVFLLQIMPGSCDHAMFGVLF